MMKKVCMMIAGMMLMWGTAWGVGISYIFNNDTKLMVVFDDGRELAALCADAKAVRPDAEYIQVAADRIYIPCD